MDCRSHVLWVTILIFIQLPHRRRNAMRHQHAGLAITDFPLAYGKLWPDTSPEAIAHYNASRPPGTIGNPITAFSGGTCQRWSIASWPTRFSLGVAAAATCARAKTRRRRCADEAGLCLAGAAHPASNRPRRGNHLDQQGGGRVAAPLHVMVGALALLTDSILCVPRGGAAHTRLRGKWNHCWRVN